MKKSYLIIALLIGLLTNAQNDVTFSVDMSAYATPFTTVYVSGEFNGWSGTDNPLTDTGFGIWSTTISLADGEYEYKFSHDDWIGQDNLTAGEACTVTNGGFVNRYLNVEGENQILETPLFSECYDDGNAGPHDVTFTVDMNAYATPFTTVYINGVFNGWSGTDNPLMDIGNGFWSATIPFTENSHEFKFSVDNWAEQESFTAGDAGTVTNSGFTNRFINVLETQSRSYVWNFGGSSITPPPAPANDNVCDAETITVDAAPITGTNTLSTFEASEPNGSCYLDPTVGNSVWYAFVSPASGAVSVSTDFDTPNGDTQIALYTITNCLDLSTAIELACNEDSESNVGDGYNSIMYATGLTPGTTYYIQVDGYDDVVGEFQIQVTALPAVPANDNACDAETLTVDAAPTSGNNASSSFETSEPNGVCYEDISVGNSVWYTIVAPASGSVNVTTDFDTPNNDTQIALYTITNCLDLSTANELACNEDGGFFGAGYNSIMDATGLTPGNTYYIQVDGYGNTIGEFQIQVTATAPGNDDCADATAIILGTEFSGDTMLATDSGIADASCSMSGGNQDVWYSFTAPVSTTVSLATTADFVAIYDACAGNEVACLSNGGQSPVLIAGNTYYVRIYNSGFAKVAGPFTATLSEASLSTQDFNNEFAFSYFPNPVNNTLSLKAQQTITNVAVFNMLGQEVIKTAPNAVSNNVDMSNLQSGAYFVQVTIGVILETVRVIKK